MARTSHFESMAARFSPSRLRSSLRRNSAASSSTRNSYSSTACSVVTINSIILRQPSLVDLEEERRSYGSELNLLEPRPIVYWGSVEERMGNRDF
ncbi:hypothetical protein ACJ41O_002985 [Fusarium nematophilum]